MTDLRFSLVDYFQYIKGNENSRVVYEGEEVCNAGHIILCGILNNITPNEDIQVYGLCLQTSALQSPPHIIKGILEVLKKNRCIAKSMVCTCKAGNSGRCKHVSAILLRCTRIAINKLEVISQTDIECSWSKQKADTKEKYKPVQLKEMPCLKAIFEKKRLLDIDKEKENQISKMFIKDLPKSALGLHNTGRMEIDISVQVTDELNDVANENTIILDIASESIIMMELQSAPTIFICSKCKYFYDQFIDTDIDSILLKTKQSKTQWNIERKYRITGSRIYEIFTYKLGNWSLKSSKYFSPKVVDNKYVRHGLQQEPNARKLFAESTNYKIIEFGLVVSSSNPWLGYSPDGIVFNDLNIPFALLEIKCPFAGATANLQTMLSSLPYLKFEDGVYFLKEKHKYYAQIQLGMALLNYKLCYFALYCSFDHSLFILEVPFNYEYAKRLVFETKEKYFKYMLHTVCDSK